MTQTTYKKYAYLTVFIAGIFALLYLFCKFALRPLLPFFLSFFFVFLSEPTARRLSEKWGGKPRIYRLIFSLLTLFSAAGVCVFLSGRLVRDALRILTSLTEREKIEGWAETVQQIFYDWGGDLGAMLFERVGDAFFTTAGDALSDFSKRVGAFTQELPRLLLFLPVLLLSTVYFALDYEKVRDLCREKLPGRVSSVLFSAADATRKTAFPYVRAYLILMGMTFVFVGTGLRILGVPSAWLLSLVIALLDVLPVIGVGTVLIPWGIYQLFFASRPLGIGLLVLYVLHEIFRQVVEPHIVGAGLGVHPLLSLLFLYVGFSLFGVPGLLLLPVFSVLSKTVLTERRRAEGKKKKEKAKESPAS